MGKRVCWCRPSTSSKPRGCWPRAMRPSVIETSDRAEPSVPPSKRLQELDEVSLLGRRKIQFEYLVVVIDDRHQRRRTAVVKVRRMLPDPAQRRGPILLRRAASGIKRFGTDFSWIMENRHVG